MIKGFLSTTLIAGRWVSSLINCFQDFFWFSCNTWSLIGSSKIRITMILIVSYMNRSRWQVPTPFYFVFSKPLDRWFTYSLSQILFLLIGGRIKNNISKSSGKRIGSPLPGGALPLADLETKYQWINCESGLCPESSRRSLPIFRRCFPLWRVGRNVSSGFWKWKLYNKWH